MIFLIGLAKAEHESVFEEDEHGLAYKTEKKMFFLANIHVTGKSNAVVANAHFSDDNERVQVEITAPIRSFDSGNRDRDKSVFDILKGEEQPNIRFISEWIEREKLAAAINSTINVAGEIFIGGEPFQFVFPLELKSKGSHVLIESDIKTSFTDFGIEPPSVGMGGMVAQVLNHIDIVVHLQSNKIAGLNEVFHPTLIAQNA
ncbi:YceI family protein [Chloroherpeton thalassium]|nr:YceI family protein [Chloroherpeton thalassium]